MRTPTYLIALLFLFMTSQAQAQFCLDGKCYGGSQQTVVRSQAPVLNSVTRVMDGAAFVVQAPVQIASNVARTAYQAAGAIAGIDPVTRPGFVQSSSRTVLAPRNVIRSAGTRLFRFGRCR